MAVVSRTIDPMRLVATPPEIFRSEMTLGRKYGGFIMGRNFLFRSDFPCYVLIDNVIIGGAGRPFFPPWIRFRLDGYAHANRRVDFRLPVGFGGNPTGNVDSVGGLVQADLLSRHGTAVLESTADDFAMPELPDPDRLPTKAFTFDTADIAINAAGGATWGVGHQIVAGDWTVRLNGDLPDEIWIKSAGIHAFSTGGAGNVPAPGGQYVTHFEFFKGNTPVGDDNGGLFYLDPICDNTSQGSGFMVNMGNYKLPLRSQARPWAAETPVWQSFIAGTAHNTVVLRVRLILNCAYDIGHGGS